MKEMKSSKKYFVLWRGDSIQNYFTKSKTIHKKSFLTVVKKFLFVGIIVCCLFAYSKVEDERKINDKVLLATQSVNLNTVSFIYKLYIVIGVYVNGKKSDNYLIPPKENQI